MKEVGITPGPVKFDNMEPNDVKQFTPSNTGTEGQVLTKGNDGYGWGDLPSVDEFTPSNEGTEGQVLTKTSNGYNWETPSGGSDVVCLASPQIYPGTYTVTTHADILASSPETFNAVLSFRAQIITNDNHSQTIDSLKASVVFNKVPNSTIGYIANVTLHPSGIYTLANNVNPMIINIVISANPVTGDTTQIALKYSGVVVFSKTFKDIKSFMLIIERFEICVNQ